VRGLVDALNNRCDALSGGRTVALVLLAALLMQALFGAWLVPGFRAVTSGLYPIDLAFPVTPAVIYREYAAYTADSRQLYHWFFLVDFFWPPLLATLFAVTWTWFLRRSAPELRQRLLGAGILLVPFAAALLDLLENLGFLALLENYPRQFIALAWATSIARAVKLLLLLVCLLLTLVLGGAAAGRAIRSGRRD
jgi:hypothetical protein